MRAAILTRPFKRLTRKLDHQKYINPIPPLQTNEMAEALLVGKAINRASKFTPWKSACLTQALTARLMLQQRAIPGVFYLGVYKGKEAKTEMRAHAWSQCGETIITGAKGHEAFTVVSAFNWTR